ncbi:WxL domain-containing protein [Enterococcus faecalis]|uniref:WxL domain-containing protein n=2 Tax=Enterococcus faecalis TaxID=1351 RepID=A0A4U3MM45_ENTFL|nr:WxL domain-containing protein [Enterococcus faecalis]EGO8665772.1 WxL domain-containing protein [Enterococcus faecalis]EGS8049476.1 WxL domain-containing protein [Enterococcus faecalis]EHF1125878.1 WxL domain-containing protein [Enterococcus faecalis]EIM5409267.1 WxL domain-containing protein [Enterococcus faecalis]EIW2081940.1 WxL domain-containing protein [Enterococcus faecalis]
MKQIKFKQLATFGLCCSLLVNSLTGVTAVAETVTIESSPTAESTKESTKESTETSEATTETSREEATQETEKQEKVKEAETEVAQVEVEQKEAETSEDNQPNPVPLPASGIGVRAGNVASVREQVELMRIPASGQVTITVPDIRLGIVLNSLDKVTLNTADFDIVAKGRTMRTRMITGGNYQYYLGTVIDLGTSKTNNSLDILIPSRTITAKYTTPYNYDGFLYYMNPINLTVPKYIKAISIKDNQTYDTFAVTHPGFGDGRYQDSINPTITKKSEVNYELSSDVSYNVSGDTITRLFYSSVVNVNPEGQNQLQVTLPKQDIVVNVENRKVTENFKDVNGTAIPAPTGFTQGKQTSITNNDYTFTQGGTLPELYTASNGKAYKFKGWYKGKTKPATLETSKTPSYKVTYDDNDDLNVVYEEAITKDYNFPSRAVSFQFLNEAGTIIPPTPFTITTDLQQEINSTYTKLGSITGTNSGNTKRVTIPAKTIKADVSLGGVNSYGTTNTRITIPKFYENISVYTGSAYTQATLNRYSTADNTLIGNPASNAPLYYGLNKMTATQFKVNEYDTTTTIPEQSKYLYNRLYVSGASRLFNSYYAPVGTIYYQLTNRKVTENFVDASGAKITAPTGFKQGKQTVIDSDDFTYTQEGTLPYIYKINNKPYVLKGWYKGKEKPAKLNQITKEKPNISYPVSYDDQDDVTVVYDELKLAGNTIQFGFVNEQGNYIPPTSKFNVSTDIGEIIDATYAKLQTVNSTINGNYLSLTIPAYNPTGGIGQGNVYYGSRNSIITIPKYYKPPTLTPPSNYNGTVYPTATGVADYHNDATYEYLPNRLNLTPVSGSQTNYRLSQVRWEQDDTQTAFSSLYKMNSRSASDTSMTLAEIYATGTVNYYLENRRVTENFVDATGAKITPPTGFKQGNKVIIDSDNFTYTSAKALPDTYTAGDKSYQFKGWYKGTDKTALKTTKTPSYAVTYDDKDDMTAVYEEVQATAEMTVNRLLEVVPNEASMIWTVRLKNTSQVPLTNVKLAPTAKWAAGISAPTQLAVRIGNTPNKIIPVTAEQWQAGVNLDIEIPVNGEALVTVNTAKITGEPRQLLTAEMTASGNFFPVTASNFVRIQGEDQTIEPTPAEEGFISTPTFDFGKIMISGSTKQYSLKKAADYYGNGTRNPYLRIKKSQPNWQLTAQLSQLKASTDSLPTSTRLLLGNADVAAIENYNQVTELTNKVGITEPLVLTSDGTSTPVILNNQFTGNDVYQLEFDFASVKLEVPANQGKINEKYQGTVTWNLVTGP